MNMNIPELIGNTAICAAWILESCQKDLADERTPKAQLSMRMNVFIKTS